MIIRILYNNMYIDGVLFCHTIYNIPAGKYDMDIIYSEKYDKLLPHIISKTELYVVGDDTDSDVVIYKKNLEDLINLIIFCKKRNEQSFLIVGEV